jgi:signal transduction histidine kinase
LLNSLIGRVILLNVLLLALGIGALTAYHFSREQAHLIDATRLNAKLLVDTIEKSIFTAMSAGKSSEVQAILERVGDTADLSAVRIFGPNGVILKSNRLEEIGQQVDKHSFNLYVHQQPEGIFRQKNGSRVISLVRPITADERCFRCHGLESQVIGVLNLNFSLEGMYRQLLESREIFVISTLLILTALAGGISLIMIRMLRRPLQQIATGMGRVEEGDLGVRLPGHRHDEVGRLMQGFNSMVNHLNQAQRELSQYHYRQMEHADRLASFGEMAAGLAHEIKNPLAGIRGAIDVLTDDYPPDDPRREIMQQIRGQVNRMNKTISDLLSFGKPGQPEFSYADINALIKQTLLFTGQLPEARNVNRVEELTKNLPPVWIDQKQLQQVILNIVLNALQAMTAGGVLTVQTDQVDGKGLVWVEVKISDTGPGIPAEKLEKIFTPFYTTKTQGTGLGLSICQQLLESNGGTIRVDSQMGQGTCFTLELPVIQQPEEGLGA